MSKSNVTHKIIALYLMERSGSPLSNAHICEFFVDKGYCDYFHARTCLQELTEADMIRVNSTSNTTMYSLSATGEETLRAMYDRITPGITEDVESFLKSRSISLIMNRDLYADYDKASYGGFLVHLRANEGQLPVLELKLTVSSEDQARAICTNWKQDYEKVYRALMESLI